VTRARIRAGLVALLVFAGASQLAAGAWIHVKAGVAQVLLRSAWARTKRDAWARTERDVSARTGRDALAPIQRGASAPAQRDDAPHRPWPWADTAPVARLTAPRLDVDLIVLDGFSAQALAFGPGLVRGENGTLVLSAHRDSHFAFLRDVRPGERLVLERAGEAPREYRVRATRVVDYRAAGAMLAGRTDALVLVTCWPFDALAPGGPLRLLVFAQARRAS
jgi:sortase A